MAKKLGTELEKWYSPTRGLMVRCWCWTETPMGMVDNGWRKPHESYPHSKLCGRSKNSDTLAYYLLYNLSKHVRNNPDAIQVLDHAMLYLARRIPE